MSIDDTIFFFILLVAFFEAILLLRLRKKYKEAIKNGNKPIPADTTK